MPCLAYGDGRMYWTEPFLGILQRAELGGGDLQTIVTGVTRPSGIALDVPAGKIYWTDNGTDGIQRANLDGSARQILVTGLGAQTDIDLDLAAGKMYWTILSAGKVQRADLDGSNIEDVVTGLTQPSGIAVDAAGGKVYWLHGTAGSAQIQRANLDGTGLETLLSSLPLLGELALDTSAGKMYWTQPQTGSLHRANLNGTGPETLVSAGAGVGMALDLAAGKVYWADFAGDRIRRANLDGTAIETLVTGLDTPFYLALDTVSIAPVIDPVPDSSPTDGQAYSVTPALSAGDPPIVWSIVSPTSPPGDMAINPATGELTWTADFDVSPVNIIIRASGPGGADMESWTVNVMPLPPVINPVPDGAPLDGQLYVETPALASGSGTITWSLVSPAVPPGNMAVNPATGTLAWTADYDDSPVSVTVQASGPGGTDTVTWNIVVTPLPPVIAPIADVNIADGQAYSVTPVLLQGSGAITWSLVAPASPPGDLSINTVTGQVAWTASLADSPLLITIQASSIFGADTESWTVTVYIPPAINPVPDGFPTDGQAYSLTLTLSAGDPPIVWSIVSPSTPPGNMAINPATGQFTWTADFLASPVTVTVQASGPGGVDTVTWTIEVVLLEEGVIAGSSDPDAIFTGSFLYLSAPYGSDYRWLKDGLPLPPEGRLGSGTSQILVFDPVLPNDSGVYTVIYRNLGGTFVKTAPFTMTVQAGPQFGSGKLPAAGPAGLLAGLIAVVTLGVCRLRANKPGRCVVE